MLRENLLTFWNLPAIWACRHWTVCCCPVCTELRSGHFCQVSQMHLWTKFWETKTSENQEIVLDTFVMWTKTIPENCWNLKNKQKCETFIRENRVPCCPGKGHPVLTQSTTRQLGIFQDLLCHLVENRDTWLRCWTHVEWTPLHWNYWDRTQRAA